MNTSAPSSIAEALALRFADVPPASGLAVNDDLLISMAARGSGRAYQDKAVPDSWLDLLGAVALASPTKSDLQQRDIIMLRSQSVRRRLAALIAGQGWIADVPMIAVFCGNNRRQRLLHEWHDIPFANDHFDAAFNAIGDAAIAMGAFVTAAETLGLGCCPISAVRNEAAAVSDLLGLPDHVFPFAGLAFGFPDQPPVISKRLPLSCTLHTDRYDENRLKEEVEQHDLDRAKVQPYATQRREDTFGKSDNYTWSEDKVRQYSGPERQHFGAYMRDRGFRLD